MVVDGHSSSIGLSEILAYIGKSHAPVLSAYVTLHRAIMSDPAGLTPAECEMIAVIASRLNQCSYCVDVHMAQLLSHLAPPRSAQFGHQLLADLSSVSLSDRERALLAYAAKLTTSPGEIGASDLHKLRETGLSDPEIEHATFVTASLNLANRVAMITGEVLKENLATSVG